MGRAGRGADGGARRAGVAVLSLACPAKRYPSVGAHHPAAIRLERAIRDLFGLEPEGLTDTRPWLDHGRWSEEQAPAASYPFLPVEGEALHQIPWVPSMPVSSSLGISASPAMAKRSSGWRNVSATPIKASTC